MAARIHAFGAWAVGGACAWEVVALATGRLPPLTAVCHRIRRHPAGFAAITVGLGWLAHHLLYEEAQ